MQKIMILISFLALTGCISEAERDARRDNAFDLAGEYEAMLSGSEVPLDLDIVNEKGNYDVFVVMRRLGESLTRQEEDLLKGLESTYGLEIRPERIFRKSSLLMLGEGENFIDPSGGDNVSKDFGKSSQFFVCSKTVREYQVNPDAISETGVTPIDPKLALRYCLSGTVDQGTPYFIDGELELQAWVSYRIAGGGLGSSSVGEVVLRYEVVKSRD